MSHSRQWYPLKNEAGQTLVRLYLPDKFNDATLQWQEIADLFIAFMQEVLARTGTCRPMTQLVSGNNGLLMVAMEPATMQELAPV